MKTTLLLSILTLASLAPASTFTETASCSVYGVGSSSGAGNCSIGSFPQSATVSTSASLSIGDSGISVSVQQFSSAIWAAGNFGASWASGSLQLIETFVTDGPVRPGILQIFGGADTADGDGFGGADATATIGPVTIASSGNGGCVLYGPGLKTGCRDDGVPIELGEPLTLSVNLMTGGEACGPCADSAEAAILSLAVTVFEADGITPASITPELSTTPEPTTAATVILGLLVAGAPQETDSKNRLPAQIKESSSTQLAAGLRDNLDSHQHSKR